MNSRKVAVEIIHQVLNKGAYSNIVLSNELNASDLGEKDKALVTEIVYGTLKYKYTIDTTLKVFVKANFNTLDDFILNLLRVSVYQMRYLDKVPYYAVVNESVNLAKSVSIGASKFVNGVLRNYIRQKNEITLKGKDIIDELALKYSFEKWMVSLFIDQYGENTTEVILQGLNMVPDLTVRVNTAKSSFEEAWNKLLQLGYEIEEGVVCPEAIKIKRGRNIENNILFREGVITVQDESAMLTAPSMDVEKGMTVYDLCSAPGGKATHLAELMGNSGSVKAFDIHENKLHLIRDNAKRLGLEIIECDVMDAGEYNEKLADSANRVLTDVPCSGLGIIRKKPEIKWNKTVEDLKAIQAIQKKIIMNASRYVKMDGILFYSTCTLNRAENEEIIQWFLKKNDNYAAEKLYFGKGKNLLYHDEGYVTILPDENMDGFFMAKLRRLK